MKKAEILCGMVCFFLCSCLGWGDMFAYEKHLVEPYILAEDPGGGGKTIYYENHGRTEPGIIAVGWDDKFLFAQQQNEFDKKPAIRYYIIPMASDSFVLNQNEITIGPLTEQEFEKKIEELGLQGKISNQITEGDY